MRGLFPRSAQTQVTALNNRGDTAGFYVDSLGRTHGFLGIGGRFGTVDVPRTTFDQMLGLNDFDRAAGFYQDAQGQDHADSRGLYHRVLGGDVCAAVSAAIRRAGPLQRERL